MPVLIRPDGVGLYHEVHGAEDSPPLILLEGMGGDIPGWRRNIPVLARELRVIAYDFRGNGNSDEPSDLLGVDRAHVYGQSFGGMVAQELALTQPARVRTLILGCTHVGTRHALRSKGSKAPKGEPWRAMYAPGFPDRSPDHVREDLRIGAMQPKHPEGGRRQWEAMQGFDSFDRLPELRVPTLILHGTEDQAIPFGNAELLAERIPGAELVPLEGAGHLYHSEKAEAADAAVLDFVRRHEGG
jgi:pimeloyl-ACP methyl ester carboxylesterase